MITYKDLKEDSQRNVRYTVVDINANCSDVLPCLSADMHNAINAQPNPIRGMDKCFFFDCCVLSGSGLCDRPFTRRKSAIMRPR